MVAPEDSPPPMVAPLEDDDEGVLAAESAGGVAGDSLQPQRAAASRPAVRTRPMYRIVFRIS
jgi:hypothetical protein